MALFSSTSTGAKPAGKLSCSIVACADTTQTLLLTVVSVWQDVPLRVCVDLTWEYRCVLHAYRFSEKEKRVKGFLKICASEASWWLRAERSVKRH